MEVNFSDTFFKSLKTLAWHESKIYKSYSLFRYDLPRFFRNVWRFRKVLWNHQWWDYRFTLETLHTSLSIMEEGMSTKGWEVRETRDKKVEKMRRVLELLQHKIDDDYVDRAEKELGDIRYTPWEFEEVEGNSDLVKMVDNDSDEDKQHNRKVFELAREIEEKEWREIWDIFRGQDPEEWKKIQNELTEEEKHEWDHYGKWYDGTDLRGWWD
jgi:hypothetical protein